MENLKYSRLPHPRITVLMGEVMHASAPQKA
jgi:hypothetical protein